MFKNLLKSKNKKFLLASILITASLAGLWSYFNFSLLNVKTVQAGSSQNVYGFAWSGNIGWISFNNTSGGGAINYGVNMDVSTGDFSGYAWSENTGWVSFNRSDTGNPPAAPFNGGSGPIAQLNWGAGTVTGWARVLSLANGADGGWIKMAGQTYQIRLSGDEFMGFAWGEDSIGWISFNSKNCDVDGDGVYEGSGETGGPAPTGCPTSGTAHPYAVKIDLTLPMPANFRVTGNICGQLDLAWDDISGESSYTLERAVSGLSNWAGVNGSPLAANTISYSDTLIAPSTSYDYRLKACVSVFCSDWATLSNIVSACCPSFSLSSSNSIWATIPAGGTGNVNSTRTTISVSSASCGFNNPVNLSIQSISGPPGSDTSGFVFHFGKSGGASTATLVSSGGVYDTTTFWVSIPDSAIRGTYIINIKGDGSVVISNVTVDLSLDIVTPFWIEF